MELEPGEGHGPGPTLPEEGLDGGSYGGDAGQDTAPAQIRVSGGANVLQGESNKEKRFKSFSP